MFEQPDVSLNPTSAVDPSDASLKQLAQLPDDGPILMLSLLEFAPDHGRERYAEYRRVAAAAIQDRGGMVLYHGERITGLADASVGWDSVVCARYPSRAAYLDLQRDTAYRKALPDCRLGLARRLLYVTHPGFLASGSPSVPLTLDPVTPTDDNEIFVINLMRFRGQEGLADYAKYSAVVGPEIRKRRGAPVLLLEGELPLVSDGFWHNAGLVRYPDIETVSSMTASEKWQSANEHRERGLHGTIAFPTRPLKL
jgi:uncharacterized protein (DUF1330 family)